MFTYDILTRLLHLPDFKWSDGVTTEDYDAWQATQPAWRHWLLVSAEEFDANCRSRLFDWLMEHALRVYNYDDKLDVKRATYALGCVLVENRLRELLVNTGWYDF